ncbi:MAG: GNAT family N-acetyltransferase [Verrucomicrobiota bacterium]
MEYQYREFVPSDLEGVLGVRNAIFAPITEQDWHREAQMSASLALDETGSIVGAIPLSFRDFRAGEGLILKTVFENAVGTREELRGKGVGAQMISSAKNFLQGRCDALFLYRGAERSDGYRFYIKTGHQDLHYSRTFKLERPQKTGRGLSTVKKGVEEILPKEPLLLEVFESAFFGFGGFRERGVGYYRFALEGLIYAAHPHEFYIIEFEKNEVLQGYAIVGIRQKTKLDGSLHVMEFATRNRSLEVADELFLAIADFASEKELSVTFATSDTSPYRSLLKAKGYDESERHQMVMTQILDYPALARKSWIPRDRLRGMEIKVWTPSRDFLLQEGSGISSKKILLEMKDDILGRLLNRRLRLKEAIAMELVTVLGADEMDIEEMAKALPYVPWIYHEIDYI